MMFRARGKDTSRVMTIDDMLSYRDAYSQPLPDFNFDNIMIEAMRANQPAPPPTLVSSENAFKHVDVKTLSDDQQYRRKIQVLLNKLTESNADILIGEILVPEVLLENNVTVVVELIFDKALDEPFFLTTYIKLISALSKYETAQEGINCSTPNSPTAPSPLSSAVASTTASTSRVRRSLINKSQATFEEQLGKVTDGMSEEEIDRCRRKEVANVNFVAELLNNNLLAWRVFVSIVQALFADPPNDLHVELGIKLVNICGKKIDEGGPEIKASKKYHPSDCYAYIEKIAASVDKPPAGISFRVWFAAKNLVELRAHKWAPKVVKAEVAPPPPPPPPVTKAAPVKDVNAAKRLAEAQPPEWLTDDMKRDIVKRATKDLTGKSEEGEATVINWDPIVSDLGTMKSDVLPPICRRACAFPLIKHFCSTPKEAIRQGLLPLFTKLGVQEIQHAAAWVIADAIMCCELEDAPKFFDRLALLLTESVTQSVVESVFARANAFLDALYADNDGEARWHSEYLKAWDAYLAAVIKKGIQLTTADKVLDAFAKYSTGFLSSVLIDMVEKLCSDGLASREDVSKWVANATKSKNEKMLAVGDELSILF